MDESVKSVTISITLSNTYNLNIPQSYTEEQIEEYLETLLPSTDWNIDDWCYIVENGRD